MKSLHVAILLLFAMLIGCASSAGTKSVATAADGNVVTTYDDAKYGIRLTYPGDWEEQSIPFMLRPKGTIIVLRAPSEMSVTQMPPTISVVANEKSTDVSLDQMQQQLIDKAKAGFEEFKLIESTDAQLGAEPARRVVYSGMKMGVSLKVMNVVALHAGKGFAVAYSADPEVFDQELPDVQKVIESIRWVK
jgi:serine/threonine-protein kinase